MSRQILPIYEMEFRGAPHRFLEVHADDPDEFQALVDASIGKGWALWTHGTVADQSHIKFAIFNKPIAPAPTSPAA